MQKCVLLLIVLFEFNNAFFSQKAFIAPEIGVNLLPSENTELGQSYQLGYHLGGQFKFAFTNNFNLITGLSLTQKKKFYQYTDTSSIIDMLDGLSTFSGIINTDELDSILGIPGINTDVIDNYKGVTSTMMIEIPFLANYELNNFNIYLGPYVTILLTAKSREEQNTYIPLLEIIDINAIDSTGLASLFLPNSNEITINDYTSKNELTTFDYGITGGIGYNTNSLFFNLLYSQGLSGYLKDEDLKKQEKYNLFRFSIGYFFELKKDNKNIPKLN